MSSRKLHRTAAWLTAFPLFLVLITGIFLQLKRWIPGIQPPNTKGSLSLRDTRDAQLVSLETIFQAATSVTSAKVKEWKDIRAIDVRPSQGVARVRTQTDYEISIDLGTGKVLQAEPRRTGVLISFHDGSAFGDIIKYGIFIPTAFVAIGLWITGMTILIKTSLLKQKNRLHKRG